ncbi:MAG: hypothetical protein ACJ765_03685 [Chloroflexota bacterium]
MADRIGRNRPAAAAVRSAMPTAHRVLVGFAVAMAIVLAACGWQPPSRPEGSPVASAVAIASTSTGPPAPLVTVETRGGECANGPCGSLVAIEADGRLHQLRPTDLVTGHVPAELLAAIRAEIDDANFPLIESRPFRETCPTAYDGQEAIYTFHITTGDREIASCDVAIDPSEPVFVAVEAALAFAQPGN